MFSSGGVTNGDCDAKFWYIFLQTYSGRFIFVVVSKAL